MRSLPNALNAWFFDSRWITVRIDPPARDGEKPRKIPCNYLSGKASDAHDKANQTDFVTASIAAELWGYKVGFVFTENDPYFFVDIDDAVVNGAWSPLAMEIMSMFPGAAIEVSNSGTGLHIFGQYTVRPDHSCKDVQRGIELYTERRYALITGWNITGDVHTDHTAALHALADRYFKPDLAGAALGWTTEPVEEWSGPEDDGELMRIALNRPVGAAAAFGNRATLRDLFEGNVDALSAAFPHSTKEYDASSADSALAYHLAYWTGRNCERILRIMQQSALVRDKWNREDYIQTTIIKAVSKVEKVYSAMPARVEQPAQSGSGPAPAGGGPIGDIPVIRDCVLASDYEDYFKGCVYVINHHKALLPDGRFLKPDQFRSVMGRARFSMDAMNEKMTDDAWLAFTNTRCGWRATIADNTAYRPDIPFGSVFDGNDNNLYVNIFKAHEPERIDGDISPFTTHMEKLLPDARDREILTSYMAALVQNPGVKFTWCPLIQGVPGNGKTTLSRVVERTIGKQHSHWPRADQLGEKFNAWLFDKCFIAVEDIFIASNREEVMEQLKPMITGESLSKRAMNTDSYTAPVCANFMLNGNRKDAIYKDKNDRRFAMFYTAQQSKEDLIRDGMDEEYFKRLYDWLKRDGYSIVANFLLSYQIPAEFNPAGKCQRAPVTTSTAEAIQVSTGNAEFVIQEAIDEGVVGFKGGFISSHFFAKLVKDRGLRISVRRYREVLEGMGYIPHPALSGGRPSAAIPLDGVRSTLYVLKGSAEAAIPDCKTVVEKYSSAQLDLIK